MNFQALLSAACHAHGDGLVHAVLCSLSQSASVRLDVTNSGTFLKLFKSKLSTCTASSASRSSLSTSTTSSPPSLPCPSISRSDLLHSRGSSRTTSPSSDAEGRLIQLMPVTNTFVHYPLVQEDASSRAASELAASCTEDVEHIRRPPPGIEFDNSADFFSIADDQTHVGTQTCGTSVPDQQCDRGAQKAAPAAMCIQRMFRGYRGRRLAKTQKILSALDDFKRSITAMNKQLSLDMAKLPASLLSPTVLPDHQLLGKRTALT